ncbi:hypothetical protein PG995_011135 [Apiospora arundinis]|uniref:Uncharacterized protein n=1 Tax=Apiospora arundinis TaxID=335852 RepID=A0ABR2IV96_9PEZI
MNSGGWAWGWTSPQNSQSNPRPTNEDWSLPTVADSNADNPEIAYTGEPAGSILITSWPSDQGNQQDFCTHPCGYQSCVCHSSGATYAQAVPQVFAYAAPDNMSLVHSDFGSPNPVLFGDDGKPAGSDGQLLSPADRDERRRPRSVPPSIEHYVQDRQPHEELACGLGTSDVRQSKKRHKRKVISAISDKDLNVQDRRD